MRDYIIGTVQHQLQHKLCLDVKSLTKSEEEEAKCLNIHNKTRWPMARDKKCQEVVWLELLLQCTVLIW